MQLGVVFLFTLVNWWVEKHKRFFYSTFTNVFFYFCHVFTFLMFLFFWNVFFYIYEANNVSVCVCVSVCALDSDNYYQETI